MSRHTAADPEQLATDQGEERTPRVYQERWGVECRALCYRRGPCYDYINRGLHHYLKLFLWADTAMVVSLRCLLFQTRTKEVSSMP
jgi:hypothetical protein